ncbi:hypothetical protein [Parachitinimonas caeni]|uniref:Bacteriocin n=1 Tax=Parachitinimonas caeni TaxID=3031301 RepID=A0ABT7DRJ0_9NEIS|nr:hypothetical protein [Parachitinimonas caeni]MDK2122666.1 hypothetical protein [Parachitinimonas caeni]
MKLSTQLPEVLSDDQLEQVIGGAGQTTETEPGQTHGDVRPANRTTTRTKVIAPQQEGPFPVV